MHTRRTTLCTRCGGRQPPAERCARCRSSELVDLAGNDRDRGLRTWHQRWCDREAKKLYRRAKSAKKGLGAFLGGGLTTVGGMTPVMFIDPVLALGIGAFVGVSSAIGGAWYWLSPRSLVGTTERRKLDAEVEVLRRSAIAPLELLPMTRPDGRVDVVTGTVRHPDPPPAPFGDDPAVAVRIAGRGAAGAIDDAWATPFDLEVDGSGLLRIEPEGWIVDLAHQASLEPQQLTVADRRFLLERGFRSVDTLTAARLAPGDSIAVIGRFEERPEPGGYRGARIVRRVVGTVVLDAKPLV